MSDDLSTVLEHSIEELQSRLADPAVRAEIPNYALLKLVGDLVKMQVKQQEEETREDVTVLQVVKEGRLPPEKRREVLLIELEDITNYREQLIAALEELDAGSES